MAIRVTGAFMGLVPLPAARRRQPRAQPGPLAVRGPRRSCTALYGAAPPAVGPLAARGPRKLRVDTCTSRHRRQRDSLGIAARAASGPEELRDSERTYASTHAYLGTACRGNRKGTVGCERAEACVTRSGHTDFDVTQ